MTYYILFYIINGIYCLPTFIICILYIYTFEKSFMIYLSV